jgi:histidine ammonia-lyase
MTVVLTGADLTLDEVVRVARGGEEVALDPGSSTRLERARAVADAALARGDAVYGLTTGVGVRKRARVAAPEILPFNRRLILDHRVGQGDEAPKDVVRATMLRLANGLARGVTAARPEVAECVVGALNDGSVPRVRMLGSVGQADLPAMADLAHGLLGDFELQAGEALALLNNNAFSTGIGALALADCIRLLDALDVAGALELEAFGANLGSLHPAIGEARPYPGLRASLDRLRALLEGSYLWDEGAARNLQDPLTFRCLPQVHGATRDALDFAGRQLGIELNAAQGNPLVVVDEGRIVSVGNFDVVPFAGALDFVRIALAPALTSAAERALKLLQAPLTDLPEGLAVRRGLASDSLSEFGVSVQGFAAEARLLAQPVSFELVSSSHPEGIEDRMTMAPLSARRLAQMVELGERLVAIELVLAAQAIDLRGSPRLGSGTGPVYGRTRETVPFTGENEPVPQDLEPIRELIRSGAIR